MKHLPLIVEQIFSTGFPLLASSASSANLLKQTKKLVDRMESNQGANRIQ